MRNRLPSPTFNHSSLDDESMDKIDIYEDSENYSFYDKEIADETCKIPPSSLSDQHYS